MKTTNEIINQMEQGVKDVFTSDKFTEFLKFTSRFHHYSYCNSILIMIQNPDATYVAGYQAWQKMKRFVNKGEHGIKILAPAVKKSTVEDENGNEQEIRTTYFHPVTVFDISQTSGEDVPTICNELHGEIENAYELITKITSATDYSIEYGDTGTAYGFCNGQDKRIRIRDGLDDVQHIKTMTHEVAHSLLWQTDENDKNSRSEKEIEAEATAYVVCSYLGIDTSSYSFEYIASWAGDKDFKALKKLLTNIQQTSQKIIDKISA